MIKLIKRLINWNYYTIVHTATFTQKIQWDNGEIEALMFIYIIKYYPNRINKYELSTNDKVKTSYKFNHLKYYWDNNAIYVDCIKKIGEFQKLTLSDIRDGKLNEIGIK